MQVDCFMCWFMLGGQMVSVGVGFEFYMEYDWLELNDCLTLYCGCVLITIILFVVNNIIGEPF